MEGFNIANEKYYFDLDEISDYVRIEPDTSVDDLLLSEPIMDEDDEVGLPGVPGMPDIPLSQMIDVTKWELVRALIETTLNESGIIDESMGIQKLETQLSIPFRLSFNTLIKNKLIAKNG